MKLEMSRKIQCLYIALHFAQQVLSGDEDKKMRLTLLRSSCSFDKVRVHIVFQLIEHTVCFFCDWSALKMTKCQITF